MIRVEDLHMHFGGIRAVDGASIVIGNGSITGLIGPNGAGKSTLFNVIAGLFAPTSGQVWLDDEEITGLAPHALFHKGLLRTFQIAHEFSTLTVRENLMMVPAGQPGEVLWDAWFKGGSVRAREAAVRRRADEVIEFLEISHVADELAGNLSGGQKKLLELGRTMMVDAKIVFLDEVGAGVNRTLLNTIGDAIIRLNKERGYTFCMVEHDMDFIGRLCDPVIVMAEGKVLTVGHPTDGDEERGGDRGLSRPRAQEQAGPQGDRRGGAGMSEGSEGTGMARLVEADAAAARQRERGQEAPALVGHRGRPGRRLHRARQRLPRCPRRSGRAPGSSACRAGWIATSPGGRAKISQPSPASTCANPSTSRRKARSASASREWMTVCAPLNMPRPPAPSLARDAAAGNASQAHELPRRRGDDRRLRQRRRHPARLHHRRRQGRDRRHRRPERRRQVDGDEGRLRHAEPALRPGDASTAATSPASRRRSACTPAWASCRRPRTSSSA